MGVLSTILDGHGSVNITSAHLQQLWNVVLVILLPLVVVIILELSFGHHKVSAPEGCRKLGLQSESNLADQYDEKYSGGTLEPGRDANGQSLWRVVALYIFPVKSCAPVEMQTANVVATGIQYDRQFCFTQLTTKSADTDSSWNFITQRNFPKMALVGADIWVPHDPSSSLYSPEAEYVKSGGCLMMSFTGGLRISTSWQGFRNGISTLAARISTRDWSAQPRISFCLPYRPTTAQISKFGLEEQKMNIWRDSPQALDMTPLIPATILANLQDFLQVKNPIKMFRVAAEREVYGNAPRSDVLGYQSIQGFTDAYPLHIQNLASIHDLGSRLSPSFGKLNALRFRSNIYVSGPSEYNEDDWQRIRLASVGSTPSKSTCFVVSNHTTRCQLPNVDPESGIAIKRGQDNYYEPNSLMRTFRCIDPGNPSPCLGMQMVPEKDVLETTVTLRVGDSVDVLQRCNNHSKKDCTER